MNILPTTYTSVREAYSRLEIKQTIQNESENATGGNGDSVFISQYLSYEEYSASSGLTSGLNADPASGEADGGTAVSGSDSGQRFGDAFLKIIRNRVKVLLDSLNGKTDNSSAPAMPSLEDTGYYSAEQTASRIVDFALSFYSGGDRAEFASKVGKAVMKGYNEALGAAGGSLPPVAADTISRVMDQLQQFATGADLNAVV
jgi:hypothetical protein